MSLKPNYLINFSLPNAFLLVILLSTLIYILGSEHTAKKVWAQFEYQKVGNYSIKSKEHLVKQFPVTGVNQIDRLLISGKIDFYDENSLARVILVDQNHHEYLIFESYPLIADTKSFSITDQCEETCDMEPITPDSIKLEVINASLKVDKNDFYNNQTQSNTQSHKLLKLQIKTEKNNDKINKINEKSEKHKISWIAGDTSIAKKSFEEKKRLFYKQDTSASDVLPNLQGYEYYKGGIFEITAEPNNSFSTNEASSNYPPFWDWRNVHGENWMTSVKDQGNCGSCWAFSATGMTEALINLYFNQHFNYDLSEQAALSCNNVNCQYGASPGVALNYYRNSGAVPEACFPYTATEEPCSNQCADWQNQTIRINDWNGYNHPITPDEFKKDLIQKGPLSTGIPWGESLTHGIVMVGWETDITDGQPIWIYKNSWGADWGESGYAKVKLGNFVGVTANWIILPITIANNNPTINCVDKDNDGYCNWGISLQKPDTCPIACNIEKDCNDANPSLGPYDANFNCIAAISPTPSTPKPGDTNGDGDVDVFDYTVLLNHYGQSGLSFSGGDFTGDGIADAADLLTLLNNYGL